MATSNICMRTEETTLNDEANKQQTAYSSFCVDAFTITKVSLRARNWLVEQKDSAFLISTNFGACLSGLLAFLYSKRLIILYSDHLDGR